MTDNSELEAARLKMIATRFGGQTSAKVGGLRRKKKSKTRSSSAQSDAKLSTTLNKLGATNIPGIEEVNFFKEDGKVIHFKNPKVQASIAANTYIISGQSETKALQELLPGIVSQLGMEDVNLQALQNMAAAQQQQQQASIPEGENEEEDDDDDVPDLVEGNFEEVSEK
jgi:nascent polypeptide-associated complex subunit beta